MNRRDFLGQMVRTAAAGAVMGSLDAVEADSPASKPAALEWRNKQPTMAYARLGRTNFMTSRCAFGAGGIFSKGGELRLLEYALEQGLNYIDTGRAYKQSESAISGLVNKHRDRVFIVSKAAHIGWPDITVKKGDDEKAAKMFNDQLEESLKQLKVDTIDCYMVQGVEHDWVVTMDSLYEAFTKARKAGKVRFFGLATHKNLPQVCELAAKSGRYDVIMLSVNPNSLTELAPSIKIMRDAGIGVVSMKATGPLGNNPKAYDDKYNQMFDGQTLSPYQRAFAYMLHKGGIDTFNSHTPNEKILKENLAVPTMQFGRASLERLEKVTLAETRGVCHHCGACGRACPQGVPVHELLRCQAYQNFYREPGMAKDLFASLGRDRVAACTGCGTCQSVCPESIHLPEVVASVRQAMA